MTGRPDFLIVGAMKCGTTTLAAQLAGQDGVFMTTPKEPNFFSDAHVRVRGETWYRSLFADAAPDDMKGEASTHYTKLPTYPDTLDNMAAMLEQPRIIYMIRNPVERAVSHYIHAWSEGEMGDDPVAAFARHPEIMDYSRYGMQIEPYVDRFGAPSVFLTSLEQIMTDAQGEFDRLGTFLDRKLVWKDDISAQNVSAKRSRKLPLHDLLVDNPIATVLRRTLVPKAIRTRIREGRRMASRPELPETLRRSLETAFAEDRMLLGQLFPNHPAIDLCYPFLK